MFDLSTLETEEVLIDEGDDKRDIVMEYNSHFCSIFIDLERLKNNLYVVEQLSQPRSNGNSPSSSTQIILILFIMNALDVNIIIISKLITSTGGSNLLRFRNSLIKKIKPQYRQSYLDRLKKTSIPSDVLEMTKDITRARNNIVAHNSDMSLYISDLSFLIPTQRKLCNAMEYAFQAVTFQDIPIIWEWKMEDIDIDALLKQ